MPFVIFVCPMYSPAAIHMIAATAALPGVQCAVIAPESWEAMPDPARSRIVGHWRIPNLFDVEQLAGAVAALQARHGPVHRLFAALEQLQVPIAEVRERLGIAGMRAEVARNFRDKHRMKALFRANALPCARAELAHSADEAVKAARSIGYPVVIKPPEGAGAMATFRADDEAQLREGLRAFRFGEAPTLVEEFVQGTEHSCESITIGGTTTWQSVSHYRPTPLEVKATPWIQWAVLLPREQHAPAEDDIRAAAARALGVLGMDTGLTHMEWFRRPDGTIAISEVAARPPGAQFTTLISRAHDVDFVEAWARVLIFGTFEAPPRKYATGAAYLRGQGRGRIVAVHGLKEAERAVGSLICDAKLPQVGDSPKDTYEGDGYVIVRHPETAVVERALTTLISTVRVELG
ncbi:MAG: ATP-grasp domain-containing protein [Gemmatimonadetes bacterium]|nr:ATP-grasp domain-containing protein [Gemmatimonadota bacterium]